MASVQPSASVVATGLGIRYIGKDPGFVYAYSGYISVNNTEKTMLEFTTGSGIIRAKVQFNMVDNDADAYRYIIYFNDQRIQAWVNKGAVNDVHPDSYIELIIPPFTIMKCTADNVDNTNERTQVVSLTGRVYGQE